MGRLLDCLLYGVAVALYRAGAALIPVLKRRRTAREEEHGDS